MELNEKNVISMSISIDADITVFNKSKEYDYLIDRFFDNKPIKSIMKKFGYDGSFIVVNHSTYLIKKEAATTFELRMVEENE